VIADEHRRLRRRMRAQPAQEPRAIDARRIERALRARSEIEVIADRHQLHVVAQPSVVAEQAVMIEHGEQLVRVRLRIADGHRSPRSRRARRQALAVRQLGGQS
jgi:hypothetical protein